MCTVAHIAKSKLKCRYVRTTACRARLTKAASPCEHVAYLVASGNDDEEAQHENFDALKKQSTTIWLPALQVVDDRAQSFVLSHGRMGRGRSTM